MRNGKRTFIMMLMAALLVLPGVCAAGLMDHPRVAVIPFANQSATTSIAISDGLLDDAREVVEVDLQNTGMFQMLDRMEVEKLIAELLPKAKMTPVEATYLAWLDLREYGYTCEELLKKFKETIRLKK